MALTIGHDGGSLLRMKLHFHSHRFAGQILDSPDFALLKQEIIEVFETTPRIKLDPPKTRKRGKTVRIFTTDQQAINRHLDTEFEKRGWEVHPEITRNKVTKIAADFRKGRVQIEVQFGNMARWYADIYKFQVSQSLGFVDVGVSVVPMQEFAKTIDENVVYYERVTRELPYAEQSVTLPIWVIGLEPEDQDDTSNDLSR